MPPTFRPVGVTIGGTAPVLAVPGPMDATAFHHVAAIAAALAAAGVVVTALTIRPTKGASRGLPTPVQS